MLDQTAIFEIAAKASGESCWTLQCGYVPETDRWSPLVYHWCCLCLPVVPCFQHVSTILGMMIHILRTYLSDRLKPPIQRRSPRLSCWSPGEPELPLTIPLIMRCYRKSHVERADAMENTVIQKKLFNVWARLKITFGKAVPKIGIFTACRWNEVFPSDKATVSNRWSLRCFQPTPQDMEDMGWLPVDGRPTL